MDRKILRFVTFCIGQLANRLQLSKPEVYNRLNRSGILYGYIVPSYDVLHTFGTEYLLDDIIGFMKEKGVIDK